MAQKTNTSVLSQVSISLLAIAFITFLAWQNSLSHKVGDQLQQAIEQRKLLIEQGTQAQTKTAQQLESFLSDLMTLAETDAQAAALVDRYDIRRKAPTAPAQENQ
jgi:Tfp pilus assembly protein PilO